MTKRDQRIAKVETGSIVNLDGCQWRVAAMDSLRMHLVPLVADRQPQVWLSTEAFNVADFDVIADIDGVATPSLDPGLYADLHAYDVLSPTELDEVQQRMDAVLLVRDGRLPGNQRDPELENLNVTQRREIVANRIGTNIRTLKRWNAAFRDRGMVGLVDRRSFNASTPQLAIDPKWREAFRVVMDNYHLKSSVTDLRLVEIVRQRATEMFGEEAPEASDRTLRRHLDVLYPRRKHNKKSAQSQANAPKVGTWWRPLRVTRPGELVAIDTNKLDVFALDAVTGQWQQLHLLMALDVFSRSIVGWRFTGWTPNSQDVKLLLRSIISPKLADPRLPDEGLWRYTGVPEHLVAGLLESDPIMRHDITPENDADIRVSGVPVLIPDEIALDHGKDYASADVRNACDLLGITMGFARPYTPTDKAHVERAFRTVNTRFCQALPGYRGPDVSARGAQKYVEDAAFYTIDEIEERFAAWVAVEYQNTPHAGLRHPSLPAAVLTPNQMIDVAMGSSGMVPIPIDLNIHVELLATEWRKVNDQGIQFSNLYYDFPGSSFLDDYRNKPGPFSAGNGGDGRNGWPIKVDRRDLSRIYFFDYATPTNPASGVGVWREVTLRDLPHAAPFQEHHLAYAKRQLVQSGGDSKDRVSVARQLSRLLADIYQVPSDELSREQKRLASRAYTQLLADQANRAGSDRLDDEEAYYTGPDSDSDAPETDWPAGGTVQPRQQTTQPRAEPSIYETSPVDEWDPFDDDFDYDDCDPDDVISA